MRYHNPIDQKVDQVQKKLVRLHADEESLAAENRQLHKGRKIHSALMLRLAKYSET